ncbi:MAG: hypothetical protein P1V20_16830 [Verrucomicrobiales bacterium]|nr:hypothetical protein [Verrucomicrobiales bacterium]
MIPRALPILTLVLVLATSQTGCSRKAIVVKEGRIAAFKNPIDLDLTHRQWEAIKKGDDSVLESYNETVENVISQISYRLTKRPTAPITLRTLRGEFPLSIDTEGIETSSSVDRIIPVDAIRVKRGLRAETRVDGIGAPLVVRQRWTPRDPMIATTGLWYPVTAVLDLDSPLNPVIRFKDPTQVENTLFTLGETHFPLQADYTASIARDLYDRQSQFVNLSGLIKYEKFSKHMGLFRISAFDASKIPVVFVHGLKSTPNTWNNTLNEMMADPVVREKYEFWTFGYPTGAPLPFLAAKLRTEMEKMTRYRRGRGAANNRVTILAHSMGGLISKPLTQSSGYELWDKVFSVPPHQLNVSESDRKLLTKMFIFEPLPYIDRVVFMAVPHKGSPLSNQKTGYMAELIIQAPNHLVTLGKNLLSASTDQLTPVGKEVVGRVPTSVQQLNENSAAIELFSPLPLNPNVKYHSIMGNEKGPDRVANFESSDGVVEYVSAHIEGVESEKVIHGKHGVHFYPEAIEEIVRILNVNVGNPANRPLVALVAEEDNP